MRKVGIPGVPLRPVIQVGHTKEIKAWLDVDNYRKLKDISLNALYHELWARALLYKPGPTDEEKKGLWVYMTEIFSGNPRLFKGKLLDYPTVNDTLYSPPHLFITLQPYQRIG
ncbi:hypothetical protein FHU10_3256 [Serratia fonticola]|uniref:Uncharacterized protein n=1 Tax=Serratia fonticola TaxID=47917 RepID=A0A542CZC2_SERFO|nr:hypothetical protein FHU09_4453 [Serratia fonticola]TQI96171.1 hypothetical protein FHU11_1595 [Serratia fonticola]TVZ70668.1 hypothetical protein FHU10_3256 [Serratia fonticola]